MEYESMEYYYLYTIDFYTYHVIASPETQI